MTCLFRDCAKPVDVVELEAVFLAAADGCARVGHSKPVRVDVDVDPGFAGNRQPFKVRVEDWEVCVVFLQDPDGGPLDGELADGVAPRLPVRRSNDFDVVPEELIL